MQLKLITILSGLFLFIKTSWAAHIQATVIGFKGVPDIKAAWSSQNILVHSRSSLAMFYII